MNILKRSAFIINLLQRAADIFTLLFVTWVMNEKIQSPEFFRMLAIYGCVIMAVVFSFSNIYKSWRSAKLISQIQQLFFIWVLVVLIFNIALLVLSTKEQLSVFWPFGLLKSKIFLSWVLFVFLGLSAVRIASKVTLKSLRGKGFNQRKAVIVGAGESGKKLALYLYENRWMGIAPIGFFDDKQNPNVPVVLNSKEALPVLDRIDACPKFVFSQKIEMVFIALPMRAEEKINKLLWQLGIKGVAVFLVPDLFAIGIQKTKTHQFGDLHLLDFNLFPAWKRVFDVIFSFLVLMAVLPLWLIIIILIKMEDGGPIFYQHTRIMENGKKFGCLKFRTMRVDADKKLKALLEENEDLRKEWEQTYKLKNDPRITKVGKLLRKTSLDEFPQFINVLCGQMSVVGARPIVSEELDKYYKHTALTYCAMKPGVTGPWQAGERTDTKDYNERVELDQRYVLDCSIWGDIKIIFKTAWRIFSPKGAY